MIEQTKPELLMRLDVLKARLNLCLRRVPRPDGVSMMERARFQMQACYTELMDHSTRINELSMLLFGEPLFHLAARQKTGEGYPPPALTDAPSVAMYLPATKNWYPLTPLVAQHIVSEFTRIIAEEWKPYIESLTDSETDGAESKQTSVTSDANSKESLPPWATDGTGLSAQEVAVIAGCHKSTVSRELERPDCVLVPCSINGETLYSPDSAERLKKRIARRKRPKS